MNASNRTNIVVVGSGGHAEVLVDALEKQGRYQVVGFLDRFRRVGERVFGIEVLGSEDDLPTLATTLNVRGAVVAIGDNFVRATVITYIRDSAPAIELVSVVHPSAVIARGAELGDGSVVLAGAVIGPSVRIGLGCIVNTRASLDHDSVMGDFSSLAPGVTTGGRCQVGAYSAVCIGATLLHAVAVGSHCVIGACTLVNRSLGDFVVAYGVPARIVRHRKEGDTYL